MNDKAKKYLRKNISENKKIEVHSTLSHLLKPGVVMLMLSRLHFPMPDPVAAVVVEVWRVGPVSSKVVIISLILRTLAIGQIL